MRPEWLALGSIGLSVAAQFLLKAGVTQANSHLVPGNWLLSGQIWRLLLDPFVFSGLFLYGVGALLWLAVLAEWDVSKAYPLVGLGFVATVVVGFVAGEQIGMARALGVGLICAGVVIVGRS